MYDKLIYETEEFQLRVTVNVFNDVEYFHFRKYYMDFEGIWVPSKDGLSMPLDLDNITQLFIAILEILSLGESKNAIQKHFSELLKDIYTQDSAPE
jgi:hypothetical protein